MSMTQLALTLLFVAPVYALLASSAVMLWKDHSTGGAIGYAVLVVIGVLVFQACWDVAGS